ncbi:MAG: DUF6732 family protein [Minwuia sp.]|uniref:DUF6732 family protein n=1 Tax=Minwuia sp. TaxID=2493630 RepID=UPI003A8C07AE
MTPLTRLAPRRLSFRAETTFDLEGGTMRFTVPILIALPGSALAHGGHLGELAGHSHWVGVAALAGAAALGALAAKLAKGRKQNEESEEAGETAEAEAEGAA